MSASNDDKEKIPRPYWTALVHPHMSWIDMIANWIGAWLFPLSKMSLCKPDDSLDTMSVVKGFREKFDKFLAPPAVKANTDKWSKVAKCPIAEYVCNIPVQKDILQKWGIVQENDTTISTDIVEKIPDTVRLVVRFPTSLLSSEMKIGGETEFGFVKVEDIDLGSFALDAPMVLQFHGGGFVLNSAEEMACFQEIVNLVEHEAGRLGPEESLQPLVAVSVDYSLAPECPFPISTIEAFSVVDYLLASNSRRKLNITGQSAGAAFALVIALESERSSKYAGRLQSVHAQSPFIDPKADTMSYYMLSKLTLFVPGSWLRWCWQAYLGMPPPAAATKDDSVADTTSGTNMTTTTTTTTVEKILQEGSNATAWEECQWNQEPFNRLARPMEGIAGLKITEHAPSFFVVVNKADTLHSEGVEVAEALKDAGFSVSLFDHQGIHVFGSAIDKKGSSERFEAWANVLFGKTKQE